MSRHFVRAVPALVVGFILFGPLFLLAQTGGATAAPSGAFAVLALGFLFGLKHAFEADHLVAVGTIVSERRNALEAARVGAMWGLGHTTSLLAAGVCVVVLRMRIPESVAQMLEFFVAVMITGLGLNLLVKLIRHGGASVHLHRHSHGTLTHSHPHLHFKDGHGETVPHHHSLRVGRKPFLVGLMHGLAGSAALMLLVLSEISSVPLALLYIVVFGLGSVGGMALVSTACALPYAYLSRRFGRFEIALRAFAALVSIGFGTYLMYEIGVVGMVG